MFKKFEEITQIDEETYEKAEKKLIFKYNINII